MAQFWRRRCRTALHDLFHSLVRGDLPINLDGGWRHSAAVERIGGEPRPQHYAVEQRISRCDAQTKRVGRKFWGPGLRVRRELSRKRQAGQRSRAEKKSAAVKCALIC